MFPDGVPAVLCRLMAGPGVIGVSVLSVASTGLPVGGVPDAVAVFATCPASTSAWVTA